MKFSNANQVPSLSTLMRQGLRHDDIDDACREVQDLLGVEDGGLASVMLEDESWRDDFAAYVAFERAGVIERIDLDDPAEQPWTRTEDGVEICTECNQPEATACECPCVNCGAAMFHHQQGYPVQPGTDCPAELPLARSSAFLGTEVKFHGFAFKTIGNQDMRLNLLRGVVTGVGPETLEVRLNERCEDLDEWSNTLIWGIEDCLFGERLGGWDRMSDGEKRAFFEGYLAGMVME